MYIYIYIHVCIINGCVWKWCILFLCSWNRHSNRKHDDTLINHGTFFGTLFSDTPAYKYIINYIYTYNIHTYLYCICELWKFLQVLLLERDVNILPARVIIRWGDSYPVRTAWGKASAQREGVAGRHSAHPQLECTHRTAGIGLMVGTLPAQIGVIFEVVWHCSGLCWNWDTTVEARLAVAGPTPCGLGFAASLLAFLQVATRKCPACRN